jgi:hypothetical protein
MSRRAQRPSPKWARSPLARVVLETGQKEAHMLWTIVVVLLLLWVLGLATSYTVGGLLHILLVLAVIMAVISLLQGRRTV